MDFHVDWHLGDGVFANGKLGSNLADFRPIISFDLATETFGEVDRPNVDYSFTNLGTLEGKLCLMYDIYRSDSKEVWFCGEKR